MTAPNPRRSKALTVLREGRVTMRHVACIKQSHVPDQVIAAVQSSRTGGPTYAVDLMGDEWTCTCSRPDCAHLLAVQLVTTGPVDLTAASSGEGEAAVSQCQASGRAGRCVLPAGHFEPHQAAA